MAVLLKSMLSILATKVMGLGTAGGVALDMQPTDKRVLRVPPVFFQC